MSFIGTRDLIASNKKGEESEIVYIDANVSLKNIKGRFLFYHVSNPFSKKFEIKIFIFFSFRICMETQ
jgi:hypothetical protein